MKSSTKRGHKFAAALSVVAALGVSANAQSLSHYYYSAGGASIAADQVGSANGTLYGAATLSGGTSGYLITDGGNGGLSGGVPTEGMLLAPSAVSGITGSFTISTWFQASGNAYQSHLFDFSDGTGANMIAALSVDGGYPYPAHGYAGTSYAYTDVWGTTFDNGSGGAWLDTGNLYNLMLSYNGSTLNMYINGALYDSQALTGFDLSTRTTVGVAGGSPWAVGDRSFNGNTYSFAIVDGALSAGQVSSVYALGQDATASAFSAAIAPVPEPSTLALVGLGLTALLVRRGRK